MNLDHTVFDYFSFWIFTWFIFFYIGIIKFNPLFFLIISGIIIYFFFIFLLFHNNISNYNITKYFIINFIFKAIPTFLIFDINMIFSLYDIIFGIILMIIYSIYMYIQKKEYHKTYDKIYRSYLDDNNYKVDRDEISRFYDNIYNLFKIDK